MRLSLKYTCAVVGALLVVPAAASAKPVFVEPDDGPDPRGLTIYGGGLAAVEPPRRLREDTIERAVANAQPLAEARAVRSARRRAIGLATRAGLTLGRIQAVRVGVPDRERYGAVSHCRRVRRPPRLRCRVPRFATASLRVTFATAETSAVAANGRAVVASGVGTVTARPPRRTSPAVRAALARAQLLADPLAMSAARRRAFGAARAARLRPRALFALAEEPRQPFAPDIVSGTFDPGEFCRRVRRVSYRRDPDTGTFRTIRGPRVLRCYVPPATSVIRMTYVVG
jgi:hypothetical protein